MPEDHTAGSDAADLIARPRPVFAPTDLRVVIAGSLGPRDGLLSDAVTEASQRMRTASELLEALVDIGGRLHLAVSVTTEDRDGSLAITATYAASEADLVLHERGSRTGDPTSRPP